MFHLQCGPTVRTIVHSKTCVDDRAVSRRAAKCSVKSCKSTSKALDEHLSFFLSFGWLDANLAGGFACRLGSGFSVFVLHLDLPS